MNAKELNWRLVRYLSNGSDIVLPNYYYGMYEMDVFRVTGAGYVFEYEIKMSRGDYFADFKKGKDWGVLKHDKIKSGDICNRFMFVTPKGLIEKHEIPDYCGHIEFTEFYNFEVNKVAPLIHKNKIQESEYRPMAIKCSFREELLRQKIRKLS